MSNKFKFDYFNNSNLVDIYISIIFCVILIITRIPFMSKFLYDWDSVNYALAFDNFNIAHLQPHPPGYIFYVATGKFVNIIFKDPNSTMLFISLLFSVLTVLIVYFLTKDMFSGKIAIISAIILIFNPIFWFYGEVASIYTAEALFATMIAYATYQVYKGKEKFIYISAIIIGLSGGFRTDLIFFMFPLWLFTIFYSKIKYRNIIIAMIFFIISGLIWYIPTIISSGGYTSYNLLTNTTLIHFFKLYSVIFGANIYNHQIMLNLLIYYSILEIGIIGATIIILFILFNYKNIFNISNLKNPKIIFLLLWILPAFLFYLLIYIPKSGYTMVYLPCLSIIIGYVFVSFSSEISHKFRISANYFIIPILILCIIFSSFQFFTNNDLTTFQEIKNQDENYYSTIKLFNSTKFNPENTIIITNNDNLYRKLTYSFSNYEIYGYSTPTKTLWNLKSGNFLPTLKSVPINSTTENIIWILDINYSDFSDLKDKIDLTHIQTNNKIEIYLSDIKNQHINFETSGISFNSI